MNLLMMQNLFISDDIYSQFKQYLNDKEYEYETKTEKAIKKLEKDAEGEKYSFRIKRSIGSVKFKNGRK